MYVCYKYLLCVLDINWSFCWLGARYRASKLSYRWEDESKLDFTSWAPNQPSVIGYCLKAVQSQAWKWAVVINCLDGGGSICEKGTHKNLLH